MNDLGKPWLGTPDPMIQYCPIQCEQELDSKLVFLVDTYGSAFDSNWWYYRTKLTKRNKICRPIKRTPLWFGQKRMPAEKPKDPLQKKLTEICECECVRAAKTCEQIVNELVNEDVSQCCFCKEKYGSEACRECPARDFPMPDEVEDDLSEDS